VKPLYLRAFFAIGLLTAAGCQNSRDAGPVIAKVGRSEITEADLKTRLQETPPAYQQYVATPEGRKQFLNLLIREKVLLEEAKRAGLKKNDHFQEAVERYKHKQAQDFKDYQESLLIQMELAKLKSSDLAVTDADVRRYYEEHSQDFLHPVEIQASHILVNTQAEAEQVLEKLKSGASFEALARAVSMDPPTAAQGGKLKPFIKGTLLQEFEDAVMAMKVGQTSGIVKTSFGYHIIKKTGQRVLPSRSFEQVKDDIQNRLQRDKFDQWVAKQQASLGVSIDEKALSRLAAAPMAPATAPAMSRSGTAGDKGESAQ
jgi:peptidyl-prolyl cis-trans isomerase C